MKPIDVKAFVVSALAAAAVAALAASHAAAAPDGAALYLVHCGACHQPTGKGIPGFFPPLAGHPLIVAEQPQDVERYLRSVIFGYHGALSVKGELYTGTMPPVGYFADLSDEALLALINYQRTAWGNAARPITAADLARVKGAPALSTGWAPLAKTPSGCGVFYNAEHLARVPEDRVRVWMRTEASPTCGDPATASDYADAYDYVEISCREATFKLLESSLARKDGTVVHRLTPAGYDRAIPPDSSTAALRDIVCTD